MAKHPRKKSSEKEKENREQENPEFLIPEVSSPFEDDEVKDGDKLFIECPGATIYEPGTRNIIAGVKFVDESDPSKGYEIVVSPVYAPEHKKRRLVKKEHLGSIRRCKACQDLTVRMMRPEGPDFYIPNPKHPNKNKLKSVEKTWQN
jgi:hypothetical protein